MEKEPFIFCTYFDKNYLLRGLALYNSLKKQADKFVLWILCFDDYTFEMLDKMNKPEIRLVSLVDFEAANPGLLDVKQDRTIIEYYWTSTPLLPLYIFSIDSNIQTITYLDADLYFFNSPEEAFKEWGDNSVYIVSHRFPKEHEITGPTNAGKYNVGYLSFRRDEEGLKCLNWWANRCIEWCFNRVEDGKLGDQKYLDDFPKLFKNVTKSKHLGVNVGEWNIFGFDCHVDAGRIKIGENRLIVFHFNCVELVGPNGLVGILAKSYPILYQQYAEGIRHAYGELKGLDPEFNHGFIRLTFIQKVYNKLRGRMVIIP